MKTDVCAESRGAALACKGLIAGAHVRPQYNEREQNEEREDRYIAVRFSRRPAQT